MVIRMKALRGLAISAAASAALLILTNIASASLVLASHTSGDDGRPAVAAPAPEAAQPRKPVLQQDARTQPDDSATQDAKDQDDVKAQPDVKDQPDDKNQQDIGDEPPPRKVHARHAHHQRLGSYYRHRFWGLRRGWRIGLRW